MTYNDIKIFEKKRYSKVFFQTLLLLFYLYQIPIIQKLELYFLLILLILLFTFVLLYLKTTLLQSF